MESKKVFIQGLDSTIMNSVPILTMSPLPSFKEGSPPFQYIEAPVPDWSYGQKVDSTEDGRKWLEGESQGWKVMEITPAPQWPQ